MPPRTEEENQRIREGRRLEILQAAAKVFARKGLAATKIADIAAAAGMSHGLVYHYFSSKDEVFSTLVQSAMDGATLVTQGAQAQPGTPWEQLRWMTTLMLEGVRQQPEYFMLVLQALTSDAAPADVRHKVLSQGANSQRAMIQLIEAGQKAGQVAAGDAAQLATLFYSCIQGLALSDAFTGPLQASFPSIEQVMRILKP